MGLASGSFIEASRPGEGKFDGFVGHDTLAGEPCDRLFQSTGHVSNTRSLSVSLLTIKLVTSFCDGIRTMGNIQIY